MLFFDNILIPNNMGVSIQLAYKMYIKHCRLIIYLNFSWFLVDAYAYALLFHIMILNHFNFYDHFH